MYSRCLNRFCALLPPLLLISACDKIPLTAPGQSTITLAAANLVLPVNGTTEIMATVSEQSGTAVQNGTLVTFTVSLGTIEPREARTAGGMVRVLFTAAGLSGTARIGALSGAARATDLEIKIGAAAADRIDLNVSPGTVVSTGGTVTLIATVIDESGNRLPGVPVSFTSSAGQLAAITVTSDANGEARNTLTTSRETVVTATAGAKDATKTIRVNTPPAVAVSLETAAPTEGQTVSFSVSVTVASGSSGIREASIDFGDGTSQNLGALAGTTRVAHTYRSSGTYTVTARATDNSGETSTQSTAVTISPSTPLAVTITASSLNPSVQTVVTFTANVTPATMPIRQYDWDFGDGSGTQTTGNQTTKTFTSDGRRTVTVTATAVDGTTGRGQIEIVVLPTQLAVTITASSSSPYTQTPVTFTANVTPATTQIRQYDWTFGDGSGTQTTGNQTTRIFTSDGRRTITVTATAVDGTTGRGQIEIVVLATQVAVTIVASPASPTAQSVVTFTATATVTPTMSIRQYDWDFGDGTGRQTTGNQTTKIYGDGGNRTVTVTVTAIDGTVGRGQIEIIVAP